MAREDTNEYIKCDGYMILKITSKKLGVFEIAFDEEDYEKIKPYRWHITQCWNKHTTDESKKKYYARTVKQGMLHRFLVECPKGKVVDHADGNEFDCRKSIK